MTTRLTRRAFALRSMTALTTLAAPLLARSALDVETFKALGLHREGDWASRVKPEMFARYMNAPEDNQYNPCAESTRGPDTPEGTLEHIENWSASRLFPGTERDVWIYQCAQLQSFDEAPNLMVFQDGGAYVAPAGPVRAPAVLDTLIHAGDLPPTVAVFVNPGTKNPARAESDPEYNRQRSLEYDSLNDRYVTFLMEELLPFVEERVGRSLATDPSQRLIAGISSGGICAFTAAWFRPDAFGRVLSHCGSFTNIRGGHNYPYLVRTTTPKPIRVFMTSGKNDLVLPVGHWPLANQLMASALEDSGYDMRFVTGKAATHCAMVARSLPIP